MKNRSGFYSSPKLDPGRLTCSNVSLKKLIVHAYDLPESTPSPPRCPPIQLRNVLAQRFKLATHHEFREMPVYDLVVGEDGSKLHAVEFGSGSTRISPAGSKPKTIPMRNLVETLGRELNRP